ncbi:hypothetical protein [Paenibacillus odorifer]|uniref:hypothetical protein n=1 Tax=Paenibacillus odorifer TaxID=189426 RepID=UPI0015C370A3|nr:hypothetical protein [Paenibacillus odorifer]
MKRKPFFTGYRPQFYFRTEANELKLSEIMAKRVLQIAIRSINPEGDTPAPKEGSS